MNLELQQIGIENLNIFNEYRRIWTPDRIVESWSITEENHHLLGAQFDTLHFSHVSRQFFIQYAELTRGFIPDNLLKDLVVPPATNKASIDSRHELFPDQTRLLNNEPAVGDYPATIFENRDRSYHAYPHQERGRRDIPEAGMDVPIQQPTSSAQHTADCFFAQKSEKNGEERPLRDRPVDLDMVFPVDRISNNNGFSTLGNLQDIAGILEPNTSPETRIEKQKTTIHQVGEPSTNPNVEWPGFPEIEKSIPKSIVASNRLKRSVEPSGPTIPNVSEDSTEEFWEQLKTQLNWEYQRFYGD